MGYRIEQEYEITPGIQEGLAGSPFKWSDSGERENAGVLPEGPWHQIIDALA